MKPITLYPGSLLAGLLFLAVGACGGDTRHEVEEPEPGYIEVGLFAPKNTPEDQVESLPWWSSAALAEKDTVRALSPLLRFEIAEAGTTTDSYGYPALWFRAAGEELGNYTAEHCGERFVFVAGGRVLAAPTVAEPLRGVCIMAGGMSDEELNAALGHLVGGGAPSELFAGD